MKNFFKENRIFTIMMAIVICCFIVICALLYIYFYKGNDSTKYGNRLEDIKEVVIKNERLIDLENKLKEIDKVTDSKIRLSGKIIYITITFEEGYDLVTAEGKAATVLEDFSDDEKKLYDFQFTVKENKKEDGFILEGAKNKSSATIIWSNNNE